jgi:A/G-specific adenine glycosylase
LTKKLLLWYADNKRSFEWRNTREPYKIWLSEVILQQTRTSQGLPYYIKFLETFPRLEDLAIASEDEVLKMWQGLGYYSRARNLHSTARFIYFECDGFFPNTFESIMKLKGVGDYTASAIASICFNIPQAVVDGNVYRFFSRYFGITTPINSSQAHKEFKAKGMKLIDASQSGNFNQALMEFGSIQCTPKKPSCSTCPFCSDCIAFNQNKISSLPIKTSKIKVTKRFFSYLVISDNLNNFLMEKRIQKGIWQNLYQFPLMETNSSLKKVSTVQNHIDSNENLEIDIDQIKLWNIEPIKHKLSHQTLFIQFWIISNSSKLKDGISKEKIKDLAVPVVINNFIEDFF